MEFQIKVWQLATRIELILDQNTSNFRRYCSTLVICWEDIFQLYFNKNYSKWFILTTRIALNFLCLFTQAQVNMFSESSGWKTALILDL